MTGLTGLDDVRFPVTISLGAKGGEETMTTIQITGSGFEYRNADWLEMRGRWDVEANARTYADAQLIAAFFRARNGPAKSFRWKSWDDYTAVNSFFGTVTSALAYPLYKTYPDDVASVVRRIVLPCDPTRFPPIEPNGVNFALYANGILIDPSTYVMDWRNGIVTFGSGLEPTIGAILTWDGEFDIPARFGMQQLVKTMYMENIVSFSQITVMELRAEEVSEFGI